jgi:hypothetical protein
LEKRPAPKDFVGFAIEFKEPKAKKFQAVRNRIAFPEADGTVNSKTLSSRLSPIQKFRWVNFPHNAELPGTFTYRFTPVFMDQSEPVELRRTAASIDCFDARDISGKTQRRVHPGFISSQAFVDRFEDGGGVKALLPTKSAQGLTFKPTHPKAVEALSWMGFEARSAILEVLDEAIADKPAPVGVVLYDLNEPGIVSRLEKLGKRLQLCKRLPMTSKRQAQTCSSRWRFSFKPREQF